MVLLRVDVMAMVHVASLVTVVFDTLVELRVRVQIAQVRRDLRLLVAHCLGPGLLVRNSVKKTRNEKG